MVFKEYNEEYKIGYVLICYLNVKENKLGK